MSTKTVCGLCGAVGVNKSTCPLNKLAKNPNAAKHLAAGRKAQAAEKSPPKGLGLKRSVMVRIMMTNVDNKDDVKPFVFTPSSRKLVAAWYKKQLSDEKIRDFKVTFVEGGPRAIMSWTNLGSDIFDEEILDPDYRAHLKIGGTSYSISARSNF